MAVTFLDTNILLRFFTKDDPTKAEQAKALLQRVEAGAEKVVTSPLVIFETIFTLQHTYQVPRPQIRELIQSILSLSGLQLPKKELYYQALQTYTTTPLSFADSYNAAYMEDLGTSLIYSWDDDFDKLPGITRIEPQQLEEMNAAPEEPKEDQAA
jgi:predicted nucleic-acid-binding protein